MSTETSPSAVYRTPWKPLGLVLAVCALVRLIVILAPGPDMFEGEVIDFEELLRGVAAKELLDGPLLPFQSYQVNRMWGGSLVVSLVALPFFFVLGPTMVALRMSPLVFSLTTCGFVFLLLDRFVGRRAAWIGGLLLALSPPGYTFISLTAYGNHAESNALAVALVYAWLALRTSDRLRGARALALGAFAGFSIWFGLGLGVVLVVLLLFELLRDKLCFTRRELWLAAVGFAVGFSPWLRYNALHTRTFGVKLYGQGMSDHFPGLWNPGFTLAKLGAFARRDWAESFWFRSELGLDGLLLGQILAAAVGLLALVGLWAGRERILAALRSSWRRAGDARLLHPVPLALAFLVAFLAFYAASDFEVEPRHRVQEFRYLVPVWPFAALLAAVGIDFVARRAGSGMVALALTAGLCGTFLAGTIARCDFAGAREEWSRPAYAHTHLVRMIIRRYQNDPTGLDVVVDRIQRWRTPEEQDELFYALSHGLKLLKRHPRPTGTPPHQIAAVLAAFHLLVEPRYRPYFEPEPPDATLFGIDGREAFWEDYARRGGRRAP